MRFKMEGLRKLGLFFFFYHINTREINNCLYKVLFIWSEIDPWLTDDIYLHPKFKEYFDERSGESVNGLYPTVTIRQLMWSLKLKPIPRHRWETCFDRREI